MSRLTPEQRRERDAKLDAENSAAIDAAIQAAILREQEDELRLQEALLWWMHHAPCSDSVN